MSVIYCGSGKTRSGQYGDFQGVSICLDDIPNEHISTAANGKRYVNLTVSKKKEVDKYGKDLSVSVDTWKPDPNRDFNSNAHPSMNGQPKAHTPKQEYAAPSNDTLPF
jgi:hypothetical protein